MKYRHLAVTVVLTGVLLTGCYTPDGQPNRTANGALLGGAAGAGVGALIGNASGHHTAEGAAIGGIVGLLTGALVGNSMDEAARARVQAQAPQTLVRVEQGQPLAVADVKALAKASISDDVIISQIRTSRSVYHLSTAEIIDLKDAGVSPKVIDFMINTATTVSAAQAPAPGTVVMQAPPPAIIYEERIYPTPGPDYVWIDGCWTWYDGRWCWARGHWAYPPYRHAYWYGGRWEQRGGSHVWMSGHWR